MDKQKFYITTAIPYVNAAPHIGFALELVQTDVIARFNRLLGKDVFFLTGTDENAQKNALAAEKTGVTPKELVDKNAQMFIDLTKKLNISNDDFIRTTDKERHWIGAKKLWELCYQNGDIYKKKYSGLYCIGCEAFVTEKDLVDGLCPEHLKKPEKIVEENYFFKLSRYENELLDIIENDKIKILPEARKNEILSFIRQGLEDFSISRPAERMKGWGIPVPGDETQIIYVWFDALANYITALGFGKDEKKFKKYWPADVHVIGKGIIRFHAIYWPAMLLSAGLELPKKIFVHGYVTSGGQKMSKTLGNVIDPFEMIEKYGVDQLRYYLLREIPVFDDGDFSEKSLIERVDKELVSKYSNLFYRVTTFIEKNFDSIVPEEKVDQKEKKIFDEELNRYISLMQEYKINEALSVLMNLSDRLNKYFQEEKPWETIKNDKEKCKKTIKTSIELVKDLSLAFYPFIPSSAEKALKCLGVKEIGLKGFKKQVKGKISSSMLFKFLGKV
ncbi:MAG: methionine--tRNA ligase [Candidatus Aenigmarchaeota archaeon]|nr:methionine--tRNA ligase [Candidatus Aenigmarchaeota archaeon]